MEKRYTQRLAEKLLAAKELGAPIYFYESVAMLALKREVSSTFRKLLERELDMAVAYLIANNLAIN